MSEGVFDPEVYGEPVYSDVQIDPEVYGELGDDVTGATNAFGQAQAYILVTNIEGCGQAQADILQTYQGYAQAQAKIPDGIQQEYGQAQADILQTYNAFAQSSALIGTINQAYGQAQACIKGNAFGQAQAFINKSKGLGQAQAFILKRKGHGQAQARIKQTYQSYGQAQAFVVRKVFGQAQASILVTTNRFAQAQAKISQPLSALGQAQGNIIYSPQVYGQAAAKIHSLLMPAPYFVAAGVAQEGTDGLTVPWPAGHQIGDIGLLFFASDALNTPSSISLAGFTPPVFGAIQQSSGVTGIMFLVLWCRATSTSMPSPVFFDFANGDHAYAQILTFRGVKQTGNPFTGHNFDNTAAGADTVISVTGSQANQLAKVDNSTWVIGISRNNDAAGAAFSNIANTSLTAITELVDGGTAINSGGGFAVFAGVADTGSTGGTTTGTVISSRNNAHLVVLAPPQVKFAQAQALILGRVYGQAQGTVLTFDNNRFGQAQGNIPYLGPAAFAQAAARIIGIRFPNGQAQARIFAFDYPRHGQANADIKTTYQIYAQAEAFIVFKQSGWGQAQADILTTYSKFGQSTALIDSSIKVQSATAMAFIDKGEGFGQARAFIVPLIGWGQAQAQIKNIRIEAWGQAQATILNRKKHGQAQARILHLKYQGYGQAKTQIARPWVQAQAQAKINSFRTQNYAQAQGYIFHIEGVGHAMARMYHIHPAPNTSGGNLIFPGTSLSINGTVVNQLSPAFAVQDDTKIVVTLTQALNDGGNIGVITLDNTYNQFFNSPVINTPYSFTISGSYRGAVVYSFSGGVYRPGLTGIGSYTVSGPFAQARAKIKIVGFPSAQAQAHILPLGRGQAQAYIIATDVRRFGQAQAHILGNTGYAQAKAFIDDGTPIIEDLLVNANTYIFNDGYSGVAHVDFTTYGNEPTDADPVYSGSNPADGTWIFEYDNAPNSAPNGWFYFTLTSPLSVVRFNTYEFLDREHDTILGIYTGTSGPGAWVVVAGNDDSDTIDTYESEIITVLPAGTYLFQIGFYGYVIPDGFSVNYANLNISITSPQGYGQAQALIKNPIKHAQAHAMIAGQTFAYGQSRAKVVYFGRNSTGLAMARVRLEEIDFNEFGPVFNASNEYQRSVMEYQPEAYYTLNEPFYPGGGIGSAPYLQSNMLYKDKAWDNVGLYDLNRTWGNIGYGPYGGDTIGEYGTIDSPYFLALTFPEDLSSFFSLPTGIPGTDGDTGILSNDQAHISSNLLERNGLSAPLSFNAGWAIEFWYRPLQTPTSVIDGILMVGNSVINGLGAITILYDNQHIKMGFGNGSTVSYSPLSNETLVAGQLYHIVYRNQATTSHVLYINGQIDQIWGTTTSSTVQHSVIIHPDIFATPVIFVMDELALYDYNVPHNMVLEHYQIGANFRAGFATANAYIMGPESFAQAQALINNPWGIGNAAAIIKQNMVRKVAQAQAYIKGYNTGQAQAYITRSRNVYSQSIAYISVKNIKNGQAKALINNRYPVAQAQARISQNTGTGQGGVPNPEPTHLVMFNGYQLPGYAQEESMDSVERIKTFESPYKDTSFAEYQGLENKLVSLRMLVIGENYLDCKNQIELAATLVRTNKAGFSDLYIQYYDRHYEALTKTIKTEASTANKRTSEYSVEFECKPWLVSDTTNTVSGTSTIQTVGRTFDNGGWTPATVYITGTDVTVSGYTETGDFTGFITVSGAVSNYEYTNEDLYIGPGVTTFEVTGATECIITYNDRWYL